MGTRRPSAPSNTSKWDSPRSSRTPPVPTASRVDGNSRCTSSRAASTPCAAFAKRWAIGPIAHAAAAHVSFASPNLLILETIRSGFHDAILKRPLRWEQGYIVAPDEPGLGIELDEQVVREHPCTTGGRLHLEMCQTPLGSNNTKTITELNG